MDVKQLSQDSRESILALREAADSDAMGSMRYRPASRKQDKDDRVRQVEVIIMAFNTLKIKDRELRISILATIFPFGPGGRVESTKDLSMAQASVLIEEMFVNGPGSSFRTDWTILVSELATIYARDRLPEKAEASQGPSAPGSLARAVSGQDRETAVAL